MSMKRGIINMLMALAASAAMTFVGCNEVPEEVTPIFPEKITASVEAGEEYEFSFTANMSWKLQIPDEVATYFKFIIGAVERQDMNGEAGTHTITVGVSDIEEFNTVRVCAIEMTMGNETKVVAELTRGGKEHTLVMYVAENYTDEETGDIMFSTDADDNYIYSSTPAERLDWVWSNAQWMQRIVIEANFDWYLSPDAPAWLNLNATEGTAGRTELFLRVNREQLPLEDVACDIEFGLIYLTNSTESNFEAIGSYPTTMEGCKDICEVTLPESLIFNAEGEYFQTSSDSYTDFANARISSPRGAMLILLNKNADGTYTTEGADWMTYTITEDIPEEAGDYGVWERSFMFDVSANTTTSQREGAIAALPVSAVTAGATNYNDYIVCTITQQVMKIIESNEAIIVNDEEIMAAYNSKFEKLTSGSWPYVGAWSQVPYAYKLTYQGNNSGDDLIFAKPIANYKIYGFNESSVYDNDTCWLTIEPSEEHKDLENGYKIKSRLGETIEGYTYTNPYAGDGGENEAFIFFYESEEAFNKDEAFAFIYFILDPNYTTPIDRPEGSVVFANDKDYDALGANLKEITKDMAEYSIEMAFVGTLQYMLTLNENCQEATLIVPNYLISYPYASWFYTTEGTGRVTIHIDTAELPEVEAGVTEVRSNLTLYGEGYVQAVQLTVVYQL
ncbi:MAG: hypothetical protein IJZ09_00295 [Tidjanibacter sp.]|nr:hypothetical protein [Tidjanibacter sp.]